MYKKRFISTFFVAALVLGAGSTYAGMPRHTSWTKDYTGLSFPTNDENAKDSSLIITNADASSHSTDAEGSSNPTAQIGKITLQFGDKPGDKPQSQSRRFR